MIRLINPFNITKSNQKMLPLIIIAISISSLLARQYSQHEVVNEWPRVRDQLRGTVVLYLYNSDLTESSLNKILSQQMPYLHTLSFGGGLDQSTRTLTPKLIKTIFQSKYIARLNILDLSGTNIDDRAFDFLRQYKKSLSLSLQVLGLNGLMLGKRGFQSLSTINFNGKLRQLGQTQTIQALLNMVCRYDYKGKCHSKLAILDLKRTGITRQGFIKIIMTINTQKIQTIQLQQAYLHKNRRIKDGFNYTAYEVLASTPFPRLRRLLLADMDINDKIAEILSKWETPSLNGLSLAVSPITDQGLKMLVNKERTPRLNSLSLCQDETDTSDQTMKYLNSLDFSWTFFFLGRNHCTAKGISLLKNMNIRWYSRLILADLHLQEDELNTILNSFTTLMQQLKIEDMNDQSSLLKQVEWSQYHGLRRLIILNTTIRDSYDAFYGRSDVLQQLDMIQITNSGWTIQQLSIFLHSLPQACPKLKIVSINVGPPLSAPVDLLELSEMGYADGTYFQLGYISMYWRKGKFYIQNLYSVLNLLYQKNIYIDFNDTSALQVLYQRIAPVLQFSHMKSILFYDRFQLTLAQIMFKIANISVLPQLTEFVCKFDINSEEFFDYFQPGTLPKIQTSIIPLVIPGDISDSYVEQTLIPFFKSFEQLTQITLSLIFLNEELGSRKMKRIIEAMDYPFLSLFQAVDQTLQTMTLKPFIEKHADTLRRLSLSGNFLQEGFFDLLSNNSLLLEYLIVQRISFTVEEFSSLNRLSTDYLQILLLGQNSLTDTHIIAMINESQPNSSYSMFPKLQQLSLLQNDIRSDGLIALLQSGMPELITLNIDRNINPQYINLLLKYPNRVKILSAQDIEIYSLDESLDPGSVYHVVVLDLKTYSFTNEDFRVLGGLEFRNLDRVTLWMKNIYSCDVLKDLLKISKNAHNIYNVFTNDLSYLNSSCLRGFYSHSTVMTHLHIEDSYSSTFIPRYVELLTETTRKIQYLALINTRLPPITMNKILSRSFHGITTLKIPNNYAGDEALKELLHNDLDHLYFMDLTATNITSQSITAFSKRKLPYLIELSLSQNFLNESGVEALGGMAFNLRKLDLSGCNLTDDSLNIIKKIQFRRLESIDLSYNHFTTANLMTFAADLQRKLFPYLQNIKFRGVRMNKQDHHTFTLVLQRKRIKIQMDVPFNVEVKNSASYYSKLSRKH